MLRKSALLALAALSLGFCAQSATADTGIFGSYVVLSINGNPNTFYDLSSSTANPDFQGTNLGTFNPSAGDTLVLNGGEVDTFKNNNTGGNTGTNVTGASTVFDIHVFNLPQTTFTSVNLPFNSEFPNFGTNTGDQKWQLTTLGTNVLSGLAPGTYSFEIFSTASYDNGSGGGQGTDYASNGGNNYVATFTVVPEPGTNVLIAALSGVGCLLLFRRRRVA